MTKAASESHNGKPGPLSTAPVFHIDPESFAADPYPALKEMQAECPIARVPELGATLFLRRDDIFAQEKRIDVFSSDQPKGLMTRLMGQNMMRKDGEDHAVERRATFPAFSPRTVRDHWQAAFEAAATALLDRLAPLGEADLVDDFARPLAGEALRVITGLASMSAAEIDSTSQAMIDGIANYTGDPEVEARCRAATALIDEHVRAAIPKKREAHDMSLISVQLQAGLPEEAIAANVKLAISGGQNEPRDVIAGTAWALLAHPEQRAMIEAGAATWQQAFEEYARWISPIGMSPRRVARQAEVGGVRFEPEELVFFMFSAANRDPAHFTDPEIFDITRDTSPSIAFGAGPHFCAGAAASRTLIADVALPMLFARLPGLRLAGDPADVRFHGWAFRGPLGVPVAWDA